MRLEINTTKKLIRPLGKFNEKELKSWMEASIGIQGWLIILDKVHNEKK